MAQDHIARLHRAAFYDGTNGTAVVAEIPGATLGSGGTGQAPLVIDIANGGGQHQVGAGRYIVWTEYPNVAVTVLDIIDATAYGQIYSALCDCAATAEAIEELTGAVGGITGGKLVQSAKGTTDANGNVSFTWETAFSATPDVVVSIQTTVAEVHTTRLTAVSSSGASVHVARSPIVAVLGVNVTAAMVNASGVIVHAVAIGAP